MPIIPLESDDSDPGGDGVRVAPVDVAGDDREQLLQALELNRQLLYEHQPATEVDETAVRAKINDLLDRLDPPSSS